MATLLEALSGKATGSSGAANLRVLSGKPAKVTPKPAKVAKPAPAPKISKPAYSPAARARGYRAGAAARRAGFPQTSVVVTPSARQGAADVTFGSGLPDLPRAQIDQKVYDAQVAKRLGARGGWLTSSGLPVSPAAIADIRAPDYVSRQTHAAVQAFRPQVAKIRTESRQQLSEEAMARAANPRFAMLTPSQSLHQIQQRKLEQLGKPKRGFLNTATDVLNTTFSTIGQGFEGHPYEAFKQAISGSLWGKSSSVGSALAKRGWIDEDTALATDILLPLVATAPVGGLGAARGVATALEIEKGLNVVRAGGSVRGAFSGAGRLGAFARESEGVAGARGTLMPDLTWGAEPFGREGIHLPTRLVRPGAQTTARSPGFRRFVQPTFEPEVPGRVGAKGELFGPELAPGPQERPPPVRGQTKVAETQQRHYERMFAKGDVDKGPIQRARQIRVGGKPLSQVFKMGDVWRQFPTRMVGEPRVKPKIGDVNVKWRGKQVNVTRYAPASEPDIFAATEFEKEMGRAGAVASSPLGFTVRPPPIVQGGMWLAGKVSKGLGKGKIARWAEPEGRAAARLEVPWANLLGKERGARFSQATREALHPSLRGLRQMIGSRYQGHPGVAGAIRASERLKESRDQRWAAHLEDVFHKASDDQRQAAAYHAEGTLRMSEADIEDLRAEALTDPALAKHSERWIRLSKLADDPKVNQLAEWLHERGTPSMVREAHTAGVRIAERPTYVPHINDPQALYDMLGVATHHNAPARKGGLGGGYNPLHRGESDRPTLKELEHRGLKPETDLKRIMLTRGQAHNRMMADMAVSKQAARTGVFYPRKPGARGGKHPPEGAMILTAPERTGTIRDPHTREIILGKGGKRRIVPKEVWETLQSAYGPNSTLEQKLGGGKVVRRVGNVLRWWAANWKRLKLATPAHDVTNILGDLFRASQEGYLPRFVASASKARRAGTLEKVGLTPEQFDYLMHATGATSGGQLAHEIHAASRGVALARTPKERAKGAVGRAVTRSKLSPVTWARGYGHARVWRENIPRRSTALQALRRTGMPGEAARRSLETHFDYGDPGRGIEALRASPIGIPFATWMLKNLPAQYRNVVHNVLGGGVTGATLQAQQGLATGQSFATQAPWTQENTLFRVGKRFWGANLPSSDLNRFGDISSPAGAVESVKAIAGSAGPFVQGASLLAGQGFNLGTWRSLSKDPVPTNPLTQQVANLAGEGDLLAKRFDQYGQPVRGQSGISSKLDAFARLVLPTGAVTAPTAIGNLLEKDNAPGIGPFGPQASDLIRTLTGVSSTPTLQYREQLGGNIARQQISIQDAKEFYYAQRKLAAQARLKPRDRERRLAGAKGEWFARQAGLNALLQYQRGFPRIPRSLR